MSVESSGFRLPILRDEKTGDVFYVSQRELKLRYILPIKRLEPFFEGLSRGEVRYTVCKKCGARYFPPQTDCPNCLGSEISWEKTEGKGSLLTFSEIYVKPASFSNYEKYVIGIARMTEGFNVLAWVRTDDSRKLKVGMPVRLVVEQREKEGYATYALSPESE